MELSNEELFALYVEETNKAAKELLREQFFIQNKKLPYFIVNRLQPLTISREDAVCLANFGMLKAFNTFNLEAGVKFTSYAATIMRNEILMQLRKEKRHQNNTSLDCVIGVDSECGELTLIDLMESPVDTYKTVEVEMLSSELKQVMRHLLNDLELATILNQLQDKPLSQNLLAEKMNASQNQVSRAYRKALIKLRNYLEGDGLNECS